MELDRNSLRVLGALMEKEMTTPDAYPLSVNALVAAANQRSSRDPVLELTEDEVREALDTLTAHELVAAARDGGRVVRFEHRIRTVLSLRRDETAVLCLLLLRGAQTPGELRSRSDRMFGFDDLAQVQATLDRMAARDQPLVRAMPRAAGAREVRWAHLLGAAAEPGAQPSGSAAQSADEGRSAASALDALRAAVRELESRVRVLEERLARTGQ